MLTVHHLNQSRSKRILWLLEELEMPYQKIDHQRDSNALGTGQFKSGSSAE